MARTIEPTYSEPQPAPKSTVESPTARDAVTVELLAALRGALEYMLANCHGEPKAGTYAGDRIIAARLAIARAER